MKPFKNIYNKKKPNFSPKGPNGLYVLMGMVLCIVFAFWYNSSPRTIEALSFSKFVDAVQENRVKQVRISDQLAEGSFKDGAPFVSYIAPTQLFWDALAKNHVDVEIIPMGKNSFGGYLFGMLLMFVLFSSFYYYFRQGQGGGGGNKIFNVGKSKARMFAPNTVQVTFKDVAGAHEAKEDLKDIVDFLREPERFDKLGAKVPRGVLLSGSPGNGKTMLAKAVAGEAHCPFFSISGSDFVEVFVGVGASRVRDLFQQARKNSPCILFIDEIDAVGRQRGVGLGGGNDEREQTLNQLLTEMDGFATEPGTVIVIGATNRQDVLDKALLRPGRFDRIVEVPYPDLTSREEILKVHIKNVKVSPEVDLRKIARGTSGFSGADLANLINEAALSATKNNEESVSIHAFEQARDKIILGSVNKTMMTTDKDKEMTAYHEAGHAILNLLLENTDPFYKVTIIPRGRALGVSHSLPENDKYAMTKSEMMSRIKVALGGLLAEKIIYNDQTTGVASDLMNATRLARAMVNKYGMSDLGPVQFSSDDNYSGRNDYSSQTGYLIDQEVEKIMKECYKDAEALIRENMDKFTLLATTLLEKETILAEEAYELLNIKPRTTHAF